MALEFMGSLHSIPMVFQGDVQPHLIKSEDRRHSLGVVVEFVVKVAR